MQPRTLLRFLLPGCLLLSLSLAAQVQDLNTAGTAVPLIAVDRGPHQTTWKYTLPLQGPDGQLTNVIQRYVQLESGLNYQDAKGQWQESGTEIELVPGGAQFVRDQQQVTFSTDLNTTGAVQVRTAEGLILKTRVLGLAYYDLSSGQSVLIAQLQDSTGELLPNHQQIIYPNAFAEVAADVRYTVTRSSFEQDIVLREQLPDPAQYGLSPNSALQVLTEFFDAPAPAEAAQATSALLATNRLAAGAVTPTVGDRLTFGSLSVVPGRAFLLDGSDPGVPVVRVWKQLEGRQFLIESVPMGLLQSALQQLPPAPVKQAQHTARDLKKYVQTHRSPDRRQTASVRNMRRDTASASPRPGLVLDYSTISGYLTNLTFQGDTTYYVTGALYLSGMTTIEGGTVVKYANGTNAQCQVSGTIVCQTGFYTPAFFTAKDDNIVGATISGGSGFPSGRYASTALAILDNTSDLRNLRIGWATTAVSYAANSGWPHYLTHVQVLNCDTGINCQSSTFWVRNGLFNNVGTVFSGTSGTTGNCEHLTVDSATYFNGTAGLNLRVTNSLLANVTTLGSYSGAGNATDTSSAFQTVGEGAHYLANGSAHHGAGTGPISYQLQVDFRSFTTYPPLLMFGTSLGNNAVLGPQVTRDVSATPDRGYHYPALDYLMGVVTITNGLTTIQPGTAIAEFCVPGIVLVNSGQLVAQGTADQMIQFMPFGVVQEQHNIWVSYTSQYLIMGPGHSFVSSPAPPSLSLRFAQFSQPGGNGWGIYSQTDWYAFRSLVVQDCQFFNCGNQFWGTWGTPNTQALTNNLFVRSPCSFVGWQTLYAYNNLIYGGSSYFQNSQGGTWWFRDNAFHSTAMTDLSPAGWVTNDHNAYLGAGQGQLQNSGGNNVVVSSFSYAGGPYGPWYQGSTNLVDRGSRLASAAGLYHHTTQISQAKETNSTVDIGFHYVAASPAESEIAKTGITATASSNAYGWVPSYTLGGLTTDPGWHNAAYAENPAYLRLNLGSSKTVDRVGYVPRVMSTNWTDGSWNGVFRKFNVYVTDDASGNPANWGTPVASGEWFWPNRQERKDVSFTPKTGRYVYFQRVSAWGWYGPQDPNWANYGYPPGYASADEVYVYQRNRLWSSALDTDGDGIPDYLEDRNGNGVYDSTLDLANWTSADTRGEGIPDGWQWDYFGSLQPAAGDYDGDGVSNLQEYLDGSDPNKIQFAIGVTNQYVRTGSVPLQLAVTGGVPSSAAVLVDGTNFAGALWLGSSPNLTVNLGSTPGWHDVWVGLRGRLTTSQQTWQWQRLNLDPTPPTLVITSPVTNTTSQPVIQIQGYCAEPLASLTYDLVNSATNDTGELGFVLSQWFDTNTCAVTTNRFQLFDVALANGTNTFTLHATDLAGNTTNVTLTYTLDLSSDHTPPAITVLWPANGAQVAADTFDLRGQLDDPTATVTVSGLTETPVEGIVERNGQFWVEGLPLATGANPLTLTATDAAGNASTQTLTLTRSTVTLSMDPPATGDLANSYLASVAGTVSDTQHAVWVNGVRATVNADLTWNVANVPLNAGGTVVLQARAIPLSSNGGNGQTPSGGRGSNPDDPAATTHELHPERDYYIYMASATEERDDLRQLPVPADQVEHLHVSLKLVSGEGGFRDEIDHMGDGTTYESHFIYPDIGMMGTDVNTGEGVAAPELSYEHCAVIDLGTADVYSRYAHTTMMLHTGGGKAVAAKTQRHLFSLQADAYHMLQSRELPPYLLSPWSPITRANVRICNQTLGADGWLYLVLSDNAEIDLTPRVANDHYTYSVNATKHQLIIQANGHDLATETPEFCVGEKVVFTAALSPQPPVTASTVQWVLPANYVNEPYPYSSTCTSYRVNPSLLQQWTSPCWFVNGPSGHVTFGATLAFSNGQHAVVTRSGALLIYRPTTIFDDNPPAVASIDSGCIVLGPSLNMRFRTRIQTKAPFFGQAAYTQLVTRSDEWPNPSTVGAPQLDGCEFYGFPQGADDTVEIWGDNAVAFNDTPTSPLASWWYNHTISDTFCAYLRFRPSTGTRANNIYVTLRRIPWSWTASAAYANDIWTVVQQSVSRPPASGTDSDEFPVWHDVFLHVDN